MTRGEFPECRERQKRKQNNNTGLYREKGDAEKPGLA